MDQRIEAFPADVLALAGEDLDAIGEGVRVALAVRGDLPAAGAEEAHEGPSGSRLPRAVPGSRSRGVAAPLGFCQAGAVPLGILLNGSRGGPRTSVHGTVSATQSSRPRSHPLGPISESPSGQPPIVARGNTTQALSGNRKRNTRNP